MNSVIRRIFLDFLVLVMAFIAPWWLTLIVALACMLRYGMHETAFAGVLYDALYGGGSLAILHTLIFAAGAGLSWYVRPRLFV